MNFPKMALIEQMFERTRVEDVYAHVVCELKRINLRGKVKSGQKVAITAGSRGIAQIAEITRAVVDRIKECRAEPFIFPAMGSHGSAVAEGQRALLANYGITEESMGCPIYATMEVEEIGTNPDGLPVFVDKYARSADHIVVINRVKPHTKFKGDIESGLMKMMAIGMGKRHGADLYHKASVQFGMNRLIETVGLVVMEKCPILCGVALVENGNHETAMVRAVLPQELFDQEKLLLIEARRLMPRIPFSDIDLLIVDQMGKDIAGTGMDTNVTGVNRDIIGTFNCEPRTKRLFVRNLTPGTEGNAIGIGLADFTTTRLVQKIDRKKTYINCITGISPEKGAIPIYFDADRQCVEAAINCLGRVKIRDLRVVHIRNTLALERLSVSKAYEPEIAKEEGLRIIGDWKPLDFNRDGNLISPFL